MNPISKVKKKEREREKHQKLPTEKLTTDQSHRLIQRKIRTPTSADEKGVRCQKETDEMMLSLPQI